MIERVREVRKEKILQGKRVEFQSGNVQDCGPCPHKRMERQQMRERERREMLSYTLTQQGCSLHPLEASPLMPTQSHNSCVFGRRDVKERRAQPLTHSSGSIAS